MTRKIFLILLFASGLFFSQVRDNSDQLLHLAQSYEQAGQYKKANEIFEKLYRQNPKRYAYFNGYVRTLTALKKYDEVVAICNKKINEKPNDITNYGILGSVYFLKGENEKAEKVWLDALKINSGSNTYRTIANYAIQVRDLEFAIDLLKEGKRKAQRPEFFSFDLATLYTITMNYKDAVKEYCEVLRKNPKQYYTVRNRISSMLNSKNFENDIANEVENCYEENRNEKVAELLAYVYQQTEKFDKAFEVIRQLDENTGSNGIKIYNFANDELKNNNFSIAAEAYSYILKNYDSFPQTENVKLNLARAEIAIVRKKITKEDWKPLPKRTCIDPDKLQNPIEILERLAKNNSNKNIKILALRELASVFFNLTCQLQKADSIYSELIRIDRNSKNLSEYFLNKAKISILFNDDLNQANSLVEKSINSIKNKQSKFFEANYLLGEINFWKGEFAKSKFYFNQIARVKNSDFSNDAIDKEMLISLFAKDSVNLSAYAKADLFIYKNNFDSAKTLLNKLADNKSLFILNNVSKLKIVEILILQNNFDNAIGLLNEMIKMNIPEIFPDKPMKYLGDIYFYALKNFDKAEEIYNNFLEKYKDSLYINEVREKIKSLKKLKENE